MEKTSQLLALEIGKNDEELKTVKFDAVEATHVRLIALKGVGEFASAN